MDIGILKIESQNFSEKLLEFVSEQRQLKIHRYFSKFDKKISLFSELLIRAMLKSLGEKDWKNIPIIENNNKKPIILSEKEYTFSFSHSNNIILCALDVSNPIGADIEEIVSIPSEVTGNILHTNEKNIDMNPNEFFKIWTAKESYAKYTENGLNEDFSLIDTTSSFFKKHCVQWKEDNFICCIYANKLDNFKKRYYSEEDICNIYD